MDRDVTLTFKGITLVSEHGPLNKNGVRKFKVTHQELFKGTTYQGTPKEVIDDVLRDIRYALHQQLM